MSSTYVIQITIKNEFCAFDKKQSEEKLDISGYLKKKTEGETLTNLLKEFLCEFERLILSLTNVST